MAEIKLTKLRKRLEEMSEDDIDVLISAFELPRDLFQELVDECLK